MRKIAEIVYRKIFKKAGIVKSKKRKFHSCFLKKFASDIQAKSIILERYRFCSNE